MYPCVWMYGMVWCGGVLGMCECVRLFVCLFVCCVACIREEGCFVRSKKIQRGIGGSMDGPVGG